MKKKLGLALTSVALMIVILGATNLISTRGHIKTLSQVYENEVVPAGLLSEMDSGIKEVRFRIAGVLLDQLPSVGSQNHLREESKEISQQWNLFKELTAQKDFDVETLELIQSLDKQMTKNLPDFFSKLDKAYSANNKAVLTTMLEDEWPAMQTHVLKPLGKLVPIQREAVRKTYEKAVAKGAQQNQFGLVVLALGLALMAVIFFVVHKLTSSLHIFVKKISTMGTDVLGTSSVLSHVSGEVSEGSNLTTLNLESILSAVEELSGMVKLTSESAKSATALSEVSLGAAEKGETQMRTLKESMTGINESSKKIEQITSVIDDIAFMTNLLALNAAVEAARAGEHGKGFAVVAEEVRSLSQRSALAAKDISALISESVTKVTAGVETVNANVSSLSEIINSVKKLAHVNDQIFIASAEQSKGIVAISQSMSELEKSTSQNSVSAKSVLDASQGMESQASELQGLVSDLSLTIDGKQLKAS